MKILIIGSGAREHAIAWKLKQERGLELLCAPGNPGIGSVARLFPIPVEDIKELCALAKSQNVDLVVVGPEVPLALGIVNKLEELEIPVVGPSKEAALLESSKAFAKEIMMGAKVPTASYQVFNNAEAVRAHVLSSGAPIVLKADGLAQGKGVIVLEDIKELDNSLKYLFDELRADRVVVEEFLRGVEASLMVATDGEDVIALAPAHDYKRIFENDAGPNTGGMGSVCPTPRLSNSETEWAVKNICLPVVRYMKDRGTPFRGFLYAGLMVPIDASKRPEGIKTVEFNVRLGDPETQSILSCMPDSLLPVLRFCAGQEPAPKLKSTTDQVVSVVLAAHGYPGVVRKGDVITGLDMVTAVSGVQVFHAGTSRNEKNEILTSGGRVLTVTGKASSFELAREKAFSVAKNIQFAGKQMRRDIGN